MEKNKAPHERLIASCVIGLIKTYQSLVSPLLGQRCRFYPSCSNYALDAIKCHRLCFACWLTAKRVIKCHPFSSGGYDPVPKSTNKEK